MKITINDKEYTIKYGYEATANSGIMRKVVEMEELLNEQKEGAGLIDAIADSMKGLAEMLLVGLQKFHSDEFGYDYGNNDGHDVAISKVYDLLDDYFDNDDSDFFSLFGQLQEELVKNGFLAKMFREEQTKAKTTRKKATPKVEA